MKYIAQSTAVWDTICFPHKQTTISAPGGAGFYALVGMKIWEDDVGLVSGIGEDYIREFKPWYDRNQISMKGMLVKSPYSPRTLIEYSEDGERKETALHGRDHYRSIEATPEDLSAFSSDAEGVYIFKKCENDYWDKVLSYKREHNFRIMWEISASSANPDQYENVKRIAEQVDVFSINKTESLNLTGTNSLEAAIEVFHGWNIPLIYLRAGSMGVYLLQNGKSTFVPSVPKTPVVDVTGGGNSSSGGAFIAYCRGESLEMIGAMGNVSASLCIEQWGAPQVIDNALHEKAQARLKQVLALCKK